MLSTPGYLLPGDLARKLAEAHGLPETLDGPAVDDAVWGAGNLLLAMTGTDGHQPEISRYRDAVIVYRR
ncbi:hypothetical protein [Actinomadura sp. NTSP31]|uniref:hypothetical protein n=1 Tax=Actinomadura sp. NTSP31 TaxID=1735447 RepID=UPI0035C0EBC7